MKFGKRIRTEAVQSWGEHYVDYKVRQSPLQSKWFTQSCPVILWQVQQAA